MTRFTNRAAGGSRLVAGLAALGMIAIGCSSDDEGSSPQSDPSAGVDEGSSPQSDPSAGVNEGSSPQSDPSAGVNEGSSPQSDPSAGVNEGEAGADSDQPPVSTAVGDNPSGGADGAARLALGEGLVDAFYSYDPAALASAMAGVNGEEFLMYYQGWAEGANYEVLNREPCEDKESAVTCAITVRDDFAQALALDFDVTDVFVIRFGSQGEMLEVSTTSDDPPLVGSAFEWTFANKPEVFGGPCVMMFEGGPTPGECAQAMVGAFEEFADEQAAES